MLGRHAVREMLRAGAKPPEIARHLGISTRTVKRIRKEEATKSADDRAARRAGKWVGRRWTRRSWSVCARSRSTIRKRRPARSCADSKRKAARSDSARFTGYYARPAQRFPRRSSCALRAWPASSPSSTSARSRCGSPRAGGASCTSPLTASSTPAARGGRAHRTHRAPHPESGLRSEAGVFSSFGESLR